MKLLPSRSPSRLITLSSATMIFLTGLASAQDGAKNGRPSNHLVAAGSTAPVTAPPLQSKAAMAGDIDSLTNDSDFTIFMRPDVPDAVRVKALRKLWTMDAAYDQVAPHE